MKKTFRCRGVEDGVALIETAIVLPLLLILVAAAVDGVGLVQYYSSANSFAREIARTASNITDLPIDASGVIGIRDSSDPFPSNLNNSTQIVFKRTDFIALANGFPGYRVELSNDGENVTVVATVAYRSLFGESIVGWIWNDTQVTTRAVIPRLLD